MTVRLHHALTAPGTIEVVETEVPELPADRVRVRFLYCGICGTDVLGFEGGRAVAYPEPLGHELVGEVVAIGADVERLAPGDLVTTDLNLRCGRCDQCVEGRSHLCRTGQVGLFTNRGFADEGDLDVRYLTRIDGPPSPHLALAEPLSCALHALRWSPPQPADRVLVVGAGGIGLCMAFALVGSSPDTVFDVVELAEDRRRAIGAAIASHGTAVGRPEGEYDLVLEVSGQASGLRTACDHIRPGGRLCTMSHLDHRADTGFLLEALTPLDVTFTVAHLNGGPQNLVDAIDLLLHRWTPAWDALIEVVPLDALVASIAGRRSSAASKTIVDVAGLTPG